MSYTGGYRKCAPFDMPLPVDPPTLTPGHCAGTLTHLAAGPVEREVIFGAQGLEMAPQRRETNGLGDWGGDAVGSG